MRSAPASAPGPISRSQTLAENFDRGVALLADNELHPALPQPAMTIIKDRSPTVSRPATKVPAS